MTGVILSFAFLAEPVTKHLTNESLFSDIVYEFRLINKKKHVCSFRVLVRVKDKSQVGLMESVCVRTALKRQKEREED